MYKVETFQLILNYLEVKSVSLKIVEDIMYLVLGIKVPCLPSKTIIAELEDFIHLLPIEKFFTIIVQYVNEDEKVQKAALFTFTTEFHDLLRALEALKEYQVFVVYLEKAGLPVIESIQALHHAIGMEKYVPPKIKNLFMSLSKIQKIGDGMERLLNELYDVLPLDKIDALYRKKLKTSKVFVDFIAKITSKEMMEIIKNLTAHETYKLFITRTKEVGLDVEGSTNLSKRIIGLKPLY
ncbi:Protein G12 [Cyphomyrmex costatus]|uniref:Protein G12 n=2 Tax=Cyphomyrmex costatus TaxID=456900 RepID=A0A195CUM6_9HYME|nr:Protein G12 [Cyphomyrmex costatus]